MAAHDGLEFCTLNCAIISATLTIDETSKQTIKGLGGGLFEILQLSLLLYRAMLGVIGRLRQLGVRSAGLAAWQLTMALSFAHFTAPSFQLL